MAHPGVFLDPAFGDPSPPKGQKICSDDRSTVVQTFMSMVPCAGAEISVVGQRY